MYRILLLSAAIALVAAEVDEHTQPSEHNFCFVSCGYDISSKPLHILCKEGSADKPPPDPQMDALKSAFGCTGTPGFSAAEKNLILKYHNDLRSKVALGKTGHNDMPKAADMWKLRWSLELEAIAQAWAESCNPQGTATCDRTHDNEPVGIVLFDQAIQLLARERMIPAVLDSWAGGLRAVHVEDIRTGHLNSPLNTAGKFVQMVTGSTRYVGCGILDQRDTNRNTETLRFVCAYWPSGDKPDTPVFTVGESCAPCPLSCENGLCV